MKKLRTATITLKRDELRELAAMIERPAVRKAIGLSLSAITGTPIRRALNAITKAEMVEKINDAREAATTAAPEVQNA